MCFPSFSLIALHCKSPWWWLTLLTNGQTQEFNLFKILANVQTYSKVLLSCSGWTVLLAQLSKSSWFFPFNVLPIHLILSSKPLLLLKLGWIDKVAEPVFYLKWRSSDEQREVAKVLQVVTTMWVCVSVERGQWGNPVYVKWRICQMPKKKLETGDCQTVEKLDCLMDVFWFYYRPCGKPLLVSEKRALCPCKDRLQQRLETVRFIRFILDSYMREQSERNSATRFKPTV